MRRIVCCLMAFCCLHASAQEREVGGKEYFYISGASVPPVRAKELAVENAKTEALAEAFGTVVSQTTHTKDVVRDGEERSLFQQLASLEVKGEWVRDLEKPVVRLLKYDDHTGVTEWAAFVRGVARPISNEAIEFEAYVLRNGTEKRHADVNFHEGDDMFLYFKAPVDGFVTVYLAADEMVSRLLPYCEDKDMEQPVNGNREYVFFSPRHEYDLSRAMIDEIKFTCNDELAEYNRMYVIFSPKPFSLPTEELVEKKAVSLSATDTYETLPTQLSFEKFARWVEKLRARDPKVGRKVIHLTITKPLE